VLGVGERGRVIEVGERKGNGGRGEDLTSGPTAPSPPVHRFVGRRLLFVVETVREDNGS
jgi:hypothetical protein